MTEKPTSDPSMDEILSSIRQIISSDAKNAKERSSESNAMDNLLDILDLTDAIPEEVKQKEVIVDKKKEAPTREGGSSKPQKNIEPEISENEKKRLFKSLNELTDDPQSELPEDLQNELPQEYLPLENIPEEHLVSQEALSETAQAFHPLNKLKQEKAKPPEPRLNQKVGTLTIEDLARETLKPLLKEWLDANLPSLVRGVVNEQVEKIVRQINVTSQDTNSDKTPRKS
jgi:cell pole-organizing protein PopZ